MRSAGPFGLVFCACLEAFESVRCVRRTSDPLLHGDRLPSHSSLLSNMQHALRIYGHARNCRRRCAIAKRMSTLDCLLFFLFVSSYREYYSSMFSPSTSITINNRYADDYLSTVDIFVKTKCSTNEEFEDLKSLEKLAYRVSRL